MPGEFIAVIASHDLARRLATIYPPWIERPVRGVMQGSGNALSHLLGDALGALKYRTRPAGSAKQADEVAASLYAERKHRFIEWTDGRLIENDQNQLNYRKERTDEKGRDGK